MVDVLIVGAGPVGLVMAAELARYGVAVRIIDKGAQRTMTSKALVIWPRTMELMERMGCTDAFLAAGLRAHGGTIRGGTRTLGHLRFDTVASPYPFALMIPQSETERLLALHLQSLGVVVERETTLTDIDAANEAVTSRLNHAGGTDQTLTTPWLIGCDGAHSTVRHALGFEFHGSAQGDDWVLADVELTGAGKPPADEVATYFHRDGPFVIFPMPGDRARIVATIGKAVPGDRRPDPLLSEIQMLIDERAGGGFTAVDPNWLTTFRISERKVGDYRSNRIFLAGDAAHIHSPAGGQGMNTGMQDAINLAWKLALVIRGDAAPALLDSYSPERSAVGDMVLRNAGALTNLATLSGRAAQMARDIALRFALGLHAIQDRMVSTMTEVDIAYSDDLLSVGRGAGRRFDPEDYLGSPPGAGRLPRFRLYGPEPICAALIAQFPTLLEPDVRSAPEIGQLLIVRPDGYVGYAGNDDSIDDAGDYLDRWAP